MVLQGPLACGEREGAQRDLRVALDPVLQPRVRPDEAQKVADLAREREQGGVTDSQESAGSLLAKASYLAMKTLRLQRC